MLNIPNLPEKEELLYKEKSFLLSVYEQFQNSRNLKRLLIGFASSLIIALPLKYLIDTNLTTYLVNRYIPPAVNLNPHNPQDLKIIETKILPVVPGVFSAYARLLNPNPELSASALNYRFTFRNAQKKIIREERRQSYILAQESKFLVLPALDFAEVPVSAEIALSDINWTSRVPPLEVRFEILLENSGLNPEGQFFVEGLVRNLEGFGIKTVPLTVVVFDSANQNVIALNATTVFDLKALESRYFRVIWPRSYTDTGRIEVIGSINGLDPGLILEKPKVIPER